MLPQISILPSAYITGATSLEDTGCLLAKLIPFEEALIQEHHNDAHAVMYVVSDPEGNVCEAPRIKKALVADIFEKGFTVYTTFFGVDIDTPGHVPLDVKVLAALEEQVSSALLKDPVLAAFTAYYTTRAGMRFLYVLEEPLPIIEAEPYLLALIRAFKVAGVEISEDQCKDWTRLFRLPRVVRDGARIGKRPFDELIINPDNLLSVKISLKPATPLRAINTDFVDVFAMPLHQKMPDDLSYPDLCEVLDSKGRPQQSKFYKDAKVRLKGRNCFPCIFENAVLAHPGQRDTNIQKLVGEACSLLINLPGCTPEHVYALFLPAINVLPPDDSPRHPGWRAVCWSAICRYWPREVKKQQQSAEIEEDTWKQVIAGMRKWDASPELHSPQEHTVRDYVTRHGILAVTQQYFILKSNGRYETTPTDRYHLIARIRELGMDRVLQTHSLSNRGQEDRSIQGILNANVASGFEIRGIVMDDGLDGTIQNKNRLIRTLFRRNPDVQPEFNEGVDAWLRVFGGDQYPNLIKWIGLALAWDEGPICAISIKGPPGCGKKLFVQGLIESVDTLEKSDAKEFGSFQSGIYKSPFLVVNEGFPSPSQMPVPPSDSFRSFVSGDPIRIVEKYKVPIVVNNPLRIVFTTNNDDVIRALAGGRDLTPYDREAIAQRLFHIDVSPAASEWLLRQGGLQMTRGWISGDAGAPTNYIVAKHFRYLYEKRPKDLGGSRFLMDGVNNERLIKAMSLRSGQAPAVFEVLSRLIETSGVRPGSAVVEPDGRIFVNENMVEKYEQQEFPHRRTNHHVIKNVIASMRKPGTHPTQGLRGKGKDRTLAVWHELNGRLILEEAIERGLPCMKLQTILGYEAEDLSIKTAPTKSGIPRLTIPR